MTLVNPGLAHPKYKLGLLPPDPSRKVLKLRWRQGVVPPSPDRVDHLTGWSFDMGGNNQFGTCGPTSVANSEEMTTAWLSPPEKEIALNDVFDLYRRSGNPNFDPRTGRGDAGVVMSVMLSALQRGGIGGHTPLAYAQLDDTSDASVAACIDRFGGVLFAVTLEVAQQHQTDLGTWDYSRSSVWGGHAILAGAYDLPSGMFDVVTWQKRVRTTQRFRRNQLDEVWVILWPDIVNSGKLFDAGVDLVQLAADYETLTGRAFPVPVPPEPSPPPALDTVTIIAGSKTIKYPPGWTAVPSTAGVPLCETCDPPPQG